MATPKKKATKRAPRKAKEEPKKAPEVLEAPEVVETPEGVKEEVKESTPEVQVEAPKPEPAPKKESGDPFEVVVINGKTYKKFSRPDGTTDVELVV